MSRRPRRNPTAGFKAKVGLAALKGDKTLAEPAQQFDVCGGFGCLDSFFGFLLVRP
jgi:hypothetical protein